LFVVLVSMVETYTKNHNPFLLQSAGLPKPNSHGVKTLSSSQFQPSQATQLNF